MKKVLCFAAAAMTLFASCQKTEIVYNNDGPQEIAMFAVNRAVTKAVDGTAYPETYNMKVAAYIVDGATGTATMNTGNYFDGTIFSYKETKDSKPIWTGSRYWPLTPSTLNFLAVSQPQTNSNVETSFDNTNHAYSAYVTLTNNSIQQHDLMYAAGRGACTPNTYPLVQMKFNHALSWINFEVAVNPANAIKVNSITLNDAIYNGTLTVTNNDYNNTGTSVAVPKASWSTTNISTESIILTDNNTAETNTLTEYAAPGLLVVPGAATSFTINYTIYHEENVTNTFDYTHTIGGTWDMAKKYTYKITMNLNEIKITPDVESWTSAEKPVTIPSN